MKNKLSLMDVLTERLTRRVVSRTARRSFLGRLGMAVTGTACLPLLPVAQAQSAGGNNLTLPDDELIEGKEGDPTQCEYWRNCGMDGFLCSCCGGSHTTCPPGTEMAPITWVGTCRNPADNKDYIVAYNDCCGKSTCNRCLCNRNEGDTPNYFPAKSNDINWCLGSATNVYHCTTTNVLGLAVADE